jgi:hypothetical protein
MAIRSSLSEMTGSNKSTTIARAITCVLRGIRSDPLLRAQNQISPREHKNQAILRTISIVNSDSTPAKVVECSGAY